MSGPLESSITLEEVFAVVSAKRVPLAPELAGYLALEIAEGAGGAPGEVDPRQVYIGDEGTVALVRQKRSDPVIDKAEESIRSLLQRLLDASGSQTPALDAAAKKEAGAGIASLAQELEAALVPVNRAAGRRALARLAREVKRVTLGVGRNASIPPDVQQRRSIRGSQPSYPGHAGPRSSDGRKSRPRDEVDSLLSAFEVDGPRSDAVVSRDLKEMAGLTPTPPPLQAASLPLPAPVAAAAPASARTPAGTFPTSAREPVPVSSPRTAPTPLSSRGQALTPPGHGQGRQAQVAKRIGLLVAAVAVLVVGGAILAWILRSGSQAPAALPAEKAAVESAPSARLPRPCKATVIISDAPPRAELLVRAGQTPLEVPRMPVGARLEFVATGEGFAPKRAVIPKGATWDVGSGKPRYEMTIELEKSHAKSGTVDPWPPGEPGSEVGGHGAPGTVHIVSTPRNAEIWFLAGLGPEATIDQLACDSDVDILVAGPSTYRKRLHIGQNEFVEVSPPGGEVARKARVSAK